MHKSSDSSFALDKSLIDSRAYRFFVLENGIRVIVISSLKPGEDPIVDSSSEEEEVSEDVDQCDPNETSEETEEICEVMENKSAAALCIQVGSFSDPPEAQGLSHFLEHMVFMGSKKYPMENDFDAYLSKRGGTTNAWTGNEYTLFHFDVKRKHFAKCLDRFAHFFISPLLESSSTDRELAAVHSEFELANARDSSRLLFFLNSLASEGSPFRLFGYGNMISLREIPEKHGTNVQALLRKHQKETYSSHRMTLALHSKDTLDNLENLARELFADVPNSGIAPPDFSRFKDCFDNPTFNKFYKVCPLGDREKLRIVWTFPPLREAYESNPMGIISSLLGHEGQGSALALLKEKNLAVSLACGVTPTSDTENSSLCTIFVVYLTLTENGRDNVFDVCRIVFDYLKMLLQSALASLSNSAEEKSLPTNNRNGVDQDSYEDNERKIHTFSSYLPEYQLTHDAAFLYNEPQEPEDTVVHVANMMQLVPPEHVFSAYSLLKKTDMALYVKLIKLFTPERAAIILLSATFASSLPKDAKLEVEPWFKIRYMVEDIPPSLIEDWQNSTPSPALHLPYKNKYITTDFTLLPSDQDMKEPRDLNRDIGAEDRRRYGQLWFQQSTRFRCPKAFVIIHLWSPVVVKSKENMALHVLLNYSLNQTLSTIAYEGGEAGLEYNLEYVESGLKIGLTGFSQKLFCFYQTILDHIVGEDAEASSAHFEAYRDAIRQLYFNEALKPKVLNTHLQFYLLRKDAFLLDDLLSAVRRLTISDLIAYKQRFFASLRITAYVHGNLTAQDAIQFFDYTVKKTKCAPLEQRKFTDVAKLEPGTYQLRVMNCNPTDVNMCVARVHLLGRTDLVRDTHNQLLAYILADSAFDYLRTKETLGYHVYLRAWRSSPDGNLHSGISVVACSQANQFSASHVAGRLTAFWYRIVPRLLAGMKPDAFQTAVESLITIKQLEDPNMVTEVDRNWEEILIGEAMFNRREAAIKVLRTVTKETLLNFFLNEYLDPARQRSLLIQVDALPTPDPDYVLPSKPTSLYIKHIKMDEQLIGDEQRSAHEVDVAGAVNACGFEDKLALKVLDRLNSKLLTGDGCSPINESPVWINSVRNFRSTLSWEEGRIVV